MKSDDIHSGLRRFTILACLVLTLLPVPPPSSARAEETEPVRPEPELEECDLYYTAMLRSIELDRSRWKSLSCSVESGPWFYDAQGLTRKGGRVAALVTAYPHPNRTELYRAIYPEHTKIRKIVFVTEIDCSKHAYRQPLIRVYGYSNDLLTEHSHDAGKQLFSPIKRGTTTDTLRTLVCTSEKRKKK